MRTLALFLVLTVYLTLEEGVHGHGRLWKPAGRGTLWRFPQYQSFNPQPDYDDNQGFCGGAATQFGLNEGKCGICGDPFNEPQPRTHEGGGLYGRGIIAAEYKAGQVIDIQIDLTASHLGYFELRLCPQNNPLVPATQSCLDQHVLQLADGSGTRFPINTFNQVMYSYQVRLPAGVTCAQCVLQWHYNTGNSYGYCEDGSFKLGCGDQETFRACADVRIVP